MSLTFNLLPLDAARRRPAGKGREEPNEYPCLDEPDRPEDSFNKWNIVKLGKQKLGSLRRFLLRGFLISALLGIGGTL